MKKRLPLYLLAMVLTGAAYAQEAKSDAQKKERKNYRHEVNVSFGAGTGTKDFRLFDDQMSHLYPVYKKGENRFNTFRLGARLGIHYYYRLNRRIALGGIGIFFKESETFNSYKISNTSNYYVPCTINNIPVYNDEISCEGLSTATSIFLIPTVKFIWTDARKVRLYAKLGLGMYMQNMKFNLSFPEKYHIEGLEYKRKFRSYLAYQILPFGIEVGSGKGCFFAEFGWGTTAIFNFGLTYKFKRINKL